MGFTAGQQIGTWAADSSRKLVRLELLERAVVSEDVGSEAIGCGHRGQIRMECT